MAPIHGRNGETAFRGYAGVKLCDPKEYQVYQCPLCKNLIRNPIQTERGMIACEYCYGVEKRARDDGMCPIDGDILGEENRDRRKEKEISQLKCFCNYDGCDWIGQLRFLENHLEECQYVPISCQFCHKDISPSNLSNHLEECKALLKNGCPVTGCSYKPQTIEDMKNHLHDSVILHSYLQVATVTNLHDQITKQNTSFEKLIREKEEKHRAELDEMKLQLSSMSASIKDMVENENNRLSELEERSRILEAGQLNVPPSNTDSHNIHDPEVERLSNEVRLITKNISETDLRLQLFENTSYDGKLLWKIDNIDTRLNQAVTRKVNALHSAPTFTEKHGYKFCARLYLNGDGIGENEYVSLFFVLMKSEYDSLLGWPFNETVKFRLINQKYGRKADKEESFKPDRTSSSYVKPQKEMNIASGCPQFIALGKFKTGGFIEDNTVFIEVTVGSSSAKNTPVPKRKH